MGKLEVGLAADTDGGIEAVGLFILPEAVSCCDMEAAMAIAICSSSVIAAKLTPPSSAMVVVLLLSSWSSLILLL